MSAKDLSSLCIFIIRMMHAQCLLGSMVSHSLFNLPENTTEKTENIISMYILFCAWYACCSSYGRVGWYLLCTQTMHVRSTGVSADGMERIAKKKRREFLRSFYGNEHLSSCRSAHFISFFANFTHLTQCCCFASHVWSDSFLKTNNVFSKKKGEREAKLIRHNKVKLNVESRIKRWIIRTIYNSKFRETRLHIGIPYARCLLPKLLPFVKYHEWS